MNAIVLGAGRQGLAVTYALNKLNYSVTLIDNSIEIITEAENFLDIDTIDYRYISEISTYIDLLTILKPDFVISTLPFKCNWRYGEATINRNIRWCDLGGSIEVCKQLESYAKNGNGGIFTDLGLAPGFINVMALSLLEQDAVKNDQIHSLELYCGGLPQRPNNKLGYNCNFSVEGLVNEYFEDCLVLEDGTIKEVAGFDDRQVNEDIGAHFESFNTSGGMTQKYLEYLQTKGIVNAKYQTMRYIGHHAIVNFLHKDLQMSHKELTTIFQRVCEPVHEDVIFIAIVIKSKENKYGMSWSCLADKNFTAMQQCTGFVAAAMAHTTKDIKKEVIEYQDVDILKLEKTLETFWSDINIVEK